MAERFDDDDRDADSRSSHHEELDAQDINRIVVAYNRSQLYNARAAAATGASALAIALRFVVSLLGGG
jgi:hypothetical protein